MKNHLSLLLTFFCLTSVLGQENDQKYIITEAQNAAWIANFKNVNLNTKLEKLKTRFFTDQNVFYTFQNAHGKPSVKNGYDTITFSRPVYVIKSDGFKPIILPNNPSKEFVQELNSVLTPENVSSITLSSDTKSQVLYGARARFGAISIHISKEQYVQLAKAKS